MNKESYRKFFYFGKNHDHSVSIEFTRQPRFSFGFNVDYDHEDLTFAIYFLYKIWISFDSFKYINKPLNKIIPKIIPFLNKVFEANLDEYSELSTGIELYRSPDWNEYILDIGLLNNDMDSSEGGLDIYLNLTDLLLGRNKCTTVKESNGSCTVELPEGTYSGTYEIENRSWKRSRWFKVKRMRSIDIKIPKGLPVPGKGENSWDCGDDAIYSSYGPLETRTIAEACKRLAKDVLKTRNKYASKNWIPEKGWEYYLGSQNNNGR
jgi:hypothetical protein